MTPTETVKLVEFVHALCPHQAIDRKTPIAWHAVLKDMEFSAAQAAVIALKHSLKFIDVADIVRQAKNSADLHPSNRTVAQALEFANRRELDPVGGTPATEEFLKARDAMTERMKARDEAAYHQPMDEPLMTPAAPRWAQLPGDPPGLRAWLARQPAEAPG
jgi:hypothetical protein